MCYYVNNYKFDTQIEVLEDYIVSVKECYIRM